MSDAHDPHTPNVPDDHAHAFDGEPVQVLPPDEPRTPAYVPLLGVVLFVVAGVALLVTGSDGGPQDAGSAERVGAEAAPTPPSQAAAPAQAAQVVPHPAAGGSAPSVMKLDPERARALQQRIDEAKARQLMAPPGAPPGSPPPSPNAAGGAPPLPQPAQQLRPPPPRPAPPPATQPNAQ